MLNRSRLIGLSKKQRSKTKLHDNTASLLDQNTSIFDNFDFNLQQNEENGKRKLSDVKIKAPEKKPKIDDNNLRGSSTEPLKSNNKTNTTNLHSKSENAIATRSSEKSSTPERNLAEDEIICNTPPVQSTSRTRLSQTRKQKSRILSPIAKEKTNFDSLWKDSTLCSQRFIEELNNIPGIERMPSYSNSFVQNEEGVTVTKNEEICSQYIEINRKTKEIGTEDSLDGIFAGLNNNTQPGSNVQTNVDEDISAKLIEKINWENEFSMVEKIQKQQTPEHRTTSAQNLLHSFFSNASDSCFLSIEQSAKDKRPQLRPVSSGLFSEIGSFYGLPLKVKQLIKEYKGIDELYDWQDECLTLKAIHQRNNLIYSLPTSGGKSLVAEILMMRELLCRKKNVLLVLPYVSLCQEKISDLTPFALELAFLIEEYAAGKGTIPPIKRKSKNAIYVSTIEKSMILFDSLLEENRSHELGLIVIDELHMVGDKSRGFIIETLLSKSMYLLGNNIQIVGMSATIANLGEIAAFLKSDIYSKEFRPVELREYVKYGKEIMEVKKDQKLLNEAFKFSRMMDFHYDQKTLQRDPDHIGALVMEVIPEGACLIFCSTKQNCESVALLLAEILPQELKNVRKSEKIELMNAIKNDTGGVLCPVLTKTLQFGIAYHHSGLTSEERKHLEEAFRLKIITVLCCTSTLAAGVNLPCKRVIMRSPYVGREFLTLSKYKQMVGRAGRAGHSSTGESILICGPNDNSKLAKLFCSSMDESISAFIVDEKRTYLQTVILNCIQNKIANNIWNILKFFKTTLMAVQSDRQNLNLTNCIVDCVKILLQNGAITVEKSAEELDEDEENFVAVTQKDKTKIKLSFDDNLTVNKLGKAAVKAGISLEKAHELYKHLLIAQKQFDLSNYLHLLYLVTPNDVVESIRPHYSTYHSIFWKLDQSLAHTASIIGISELNAQQMITKPEFKGPKKVVIEKFYTTLILYDLWCLKDVNQVAQKFKVNRGTVQKLMSSAASNSSSILRFSEELEEFWGFKELLTTFTKRLAYCCSNELLPLMELPGVKITRARLLYDAGYKTVADIANCTSTDLVRNVKNISYKIAKSIIQAAKLSLVDQIDMFQEKLQEIMKIVGQ